MSMKKIYSLLLLAGLFLFGAQNLMADTYCVPGPHNGWNPASDPMTLGGDGYYFRICESVTSIVFKVSDGSWDNSWGYYDVLTGSCDPGITVSNSEGNVKLDLASAADIMIKFDAENHKIWAVFYITVEPKAHLSADVDVVIPGAEINLTASSDNFTGDVTYAYSYSTDEVNWTSIAAAASATNVTFPVSASATAMKYYFKVVASSSTQSDDAVTNVTIAQSATVAGSTNEYGNIVSDAFGTYWDMTDTNNDMVYSEGVFTLTKSKVYLPAKNLMFKIGVNHDWGFSYPGSDRELAIPQAGYYDLTFSLTWSTKTVSAVATYLYPKVEVACSFNGWTPEELTYNPSGYHYKNIPVTSGSKGFKMIVNDEWIGNTGTMTRVNCENWPLDADADITLLADVNGTYTFYYQNGNISVSYPTSFTREVNSTNYQTLCLPFDAVKPENVAIYEVTGVTANSVMLGVPDIAYLEAGKSYIIKPSVVADIIITMKPEGTEVAAPINTHMFGILGDDYQPTAALGAYILSENKFHLVAADGVVTVGSTRAYVKAVDPNAAPELRIVENATDIQNVEANEVAVKFIENGKLFIRKDNVVYDATGAVVR